MDHFIIDNLGAKHTKIQMFAFVIVETGRWPVSKAVLSIYPYLWGKTIIAARDRAPPCLYDNKK